MSTPGPLETIARIVGEALSSLATRLQGPGAEQVVEELGLRLPTGSLGSGGVPQALQGSVATCSRLPQAVSQLITAISGGSDSDLINAALQLAQRIAEASAAFVQLGTALDSVIQAAGGLTPAQRTRLRADAVAVPERLLHRALISWLEDHQPAVKGSLSIAGLIDDVPIPADANDASVPAHRLKQIRFDRLGSLFSNPTQHLADVYGFGKPTFDGLELFRRIKDFIDTPDAEAIIITPPGLPPVLEAFLFRIAVVPGAFPGLRMRIRAPAEKDVTESVPLGGPWSLTVSSSARFQSGIEMLLDPKNGFRIEPPAAAASLTVAVGLKAERPDGQPMIIIGQAGASRLELQSFNAQVPLQLSASTGSPSPSAKIGAQVDLKQGKLAIDASNADGFIGKILGGVKVESPFDLGASYDSDNGLRFTGSATIEIAVPAHVDLGPISISSVYLIGGFKDGTVPIEFSADMGAQLGPLSASVSRLGAEAKLSFPPHGGNAGPLQVDVSFKPPTGVGLEVNAGVVRGGGFLYFDFDREEYAGVLELSMLEIVTVKAIGLITTKMPDGSKGFSLLIIITAEFGTGIQLGFGFTLIGLGGLLGLNRTMNLQPLMEGVRTGAINSIMFPQNPVANAPKIISDLRTIFPPYEGKFLIGPMAKLGWGTPTLVSVALGVIIEIPGNIAILGVLKIALPAEDAALIVLQVNFAGAIEFDKSRLYFFAALFESRVLFLTLEGEMGLLVAWGDDANFVVSAGGFHPRFNPPPLPFPSPRRIAISILNTGIARIRTETYFAVTSNTVQFGSSTELMFDVGVASVEGHMSFDALFQFSPFYFIIEISAGVSLKVFGVGLFSISLHFTLEGPTPWRAHGTGTLSLFFFDVSADFDITWGETKDTTLPPIAVIPLLQGELEKLDNWRAQLPPNNNLLVSLRKLDDTESAQVLHPLGTLRVSQRAVPLDLKIDKVGNQKPSDANQFKLSATAGLVKANDADEQFAKAQFLNMKDADKLSQRAFDPMHGGVLLASGAQQLGSTKMAKRKVRYEAIIIDSNYKSFRLRFRGFASAFFAHFVGSAAVSKSALSQSYKRQLDPFMDKVAVKDGGFTVAHTENNKPYSASSTYFASEAMAHQFLQSQIAANPDLYDALHVVPQSEARF